jgi:hypothetical protein
MDLLSNVKRNQPSKASISRALYIRISLRKSPKKKKKRKRKRKRKNSKQEKGKKIKPCQKQGKDSQGE